MKNNEIFHTINSEKYFKKILVIISLTIGASILTLPLLFEEALSFILGSLASVANFIWLAMSIKKGLMLGENKAKVSAAKSALLRYSSLVIYSVLILLLIKPEIIFFGLGLLMAQIAIYFNEVLKLLGKKDKKDK